MKNDFCSILNIKSKYILKEIFDNLKRGKFLNTTRYNKAIQNKLEIDIKDYEKFSRIEIEIIVTKSEYNNTKFINIIDDKYCHIYFNGDDKTEIKNNVLQENENPTIFRLSN